MPCTLRGRAGGSRQAAGGGALPAGYLHEGGARGVPGGLVLVLPAVGLIHRAIVLAAIQFVNAEPRNIKTIKTRNNITRPNNQHKKQLNPDNSYKLQ